MSRNPYTSSVWYYRGMRPIHKGDQTSGFQPVKDENSNHPALFRGMKQDCDLNKHALSTSIAAAGQGALLAVDEKVYSKEAKLFQVPRDMKGGESHIKNVAKLPAAGLPVHDTRRFHATHTSTLQH